MGQQVVDAVGHEGIVALAPRSWRQSRPTAVMAGVGGCPGE